MNVARTIERYNVVSDYLGNQTDENWRDMVNKILQMEPQQIDNTELIQRVANLNSDDFNDVMQSVCYRRSRTMDDSNDTAETILRCFHELLNGGHRAMPEVWLKVWWKLHPTIRQSFMRVYVTMLTQWIKTAETNRWSADARDRATFDFANEIVEKQPCFPLI